MTYRRTEIGRRMSYVFTCSAMSGAFGGLIAYGLVNIQNGSLAGWQYLYLVEGIISLAFAPIAYFWIPNRVDQAWFLNSEEKKLASIRYAINKDHYDPSETFRWTEVRRALWDWKVGREQGGGFDNISPRHMYLGQSSLSQTSLCTG